MALGSYNLSHQRQAYHYYVTPQKRRISLNSRWWQSWIITISTGIAPDGVDFSTAIGQPTIAASIEAMSPTGVDFETLVGEIGVKLNIRPTGVDFLTSVGSITEITETFSRAQIGHDASSSFVSKNTSTNPQSIFRQFMFNNSIMSGRVVKYSPISRSYKDVVGKQFNIDLENASQLMNDIIEDRSNFRNHGDVLYGYATTTDTPDLLSMGGGFLTNATYNKGKATLTFKNRLDILSQLFVSIDTTSRQGASFVAGNHNPADLLWTILTASSYGGGFSNVTCYTNPQINYDSWKEWKDQLNTESIVVRGFFPYGTNIQQAIKSIAEITDSAIYVEADNRLFFQRYLTGANSYTSTVSDNSAIRYSVKGDAYDMCNKYTIPMSYNVTSNQIGNSPSGTVTAINQTSINSFGTISKEPTTKLVWYVDSASALTLANRITTRRKEPEIAISLTTPIKYLQQQLTDILYVNLDEVNLVDQPYTIIGQTIDIEKQEQSFDLSVGHGIAVANVTAFELNDPDLGTLDNGGVSVLA